MDLFPLEMSDAVEHGKEGALSSSGAASHRADDDDPQCLGGECAG
jgi:hypothetical protein